VAVAVTAPSGARASAFEVIGFGPTAIAEAGARAARADDGTAAFYSPGGLALGEGVSVELAPTLGVSSLEAAGATRALDDPFGLALAFDATVPFEGALRDHVRVAFGGYFLTGGAMHLAVRPLREPTYPYFEQRTQRLVAIPSLAVRVARGVGVGLGANVLAGVRGPADVRDGASGAPEARIEEEVTTIAAANVGLRLDPAEGVRLALVYRQEMSVPARVTTTADVFGVPIDVDVDAGEALFDPHTFVLAASVDAGRATLELDASLALWSRYAGPFAVVRAELPGVSIGSKPPAGLFRDIASLRGAASYRWPLRGASELVLRGGAGLEPSILRDMPQGRTNLVDGDKVIAGAGATLVLRGSLPRTVRLGLGQGVQIVLPSELEKTACARAPCPEGTVFGPSAQRPAEGIDDPGFPQLSGGGTFWSFAASVGVDL
jgi:hypothetical protein